jgi:hypothetical protein
MKRAGAREGLLLQAQGERQRSRDKRDPNSNSRAGCTLADEQNLADCILLLLILYILIIITLKVLF